MNRTLHTTKYKGHSINKVNITQRALGNTFYSYTIFKEINSVFISQKVNITFFTAPRTFTLPESQCVSIQWSVFSTQAHRGKLIFTPFVNIFWLKQGSLYRFFCKFQSLYFSASKNLMTVQARSTLLDLLQFWRASKEIFS